LSLVHRFNFVDVVLVRPALVLIFLPDRLKLPHQLSSMNLEIRHLGLAADDFSLKIHIELVLLIVFLLVSYLRGPLRKRSCPQHLAGLDLIGVRGTTERGAAICSGFGSGSFLLLFLSNQLLRKLVLLLVRLCIS